MIEAIQSIDAAILLFIQNNIRGGLLTPIMVFFTTIGDNGYIWLALGVVLMFFKKHRKMGFYIILCIGLSWIVNDRIIKPIVCRPRPFLTVPGLEAIVPLPLSFSFPSGHACAGFCGAVVLTRFRGGKLAPIFLLAVVIALSRIYVGVHYPSDIVAGALVGTLCGLLFTWILLRWLDKPASKLLRTPEGK